MALQKPSSLQKRKDDYQGCLMNHNHSISHVIFMMTLLLAQRTAYGFGLTHFIAYIDNIVRN